MGSRGPSRLGRILVLMAGCALGAGASLAAEPMLARVQAVAPDHLVLHLIDSGPDGESRLSVSTPEGRPAGIEPGSLVRVWPGASGASNGVLTGARVTPLEMGRGAHGHDRTGVRARLMRGAGRGFGGGRGGR